MAFSSGTFSLVAGNPVVTATTISSTVMNNTLSDIATGLSTCILKDGTQTCTATIPFAEGISVPSGKSITTAGPIVGTDNTDSTSSTTGAIKTAGGIGIARTLQVGGNTVGVGYVKAHSATATPAGGTADLGFFLGVAAVGVTWGSGAPTLSAVKGSLYLRTDGTTTNDRAYINTNGTTGWTAITTAS